jgi:hypothetical protein
MYPSYDFIYHFILSYDGICEYMSGYQGVRIPDELNACQPADGPDSDVSNMEHSTETGGQVQTCTIFAPCNNLGQILCELKAAINTNIAKQAPSQPRAAHKRRDAKFRNPSLPSVASPIPHPCAPLLHLHATPLR